MDSNFEAGYAARLAGGDRMPPPGDDNETNSWIQGYDLACAEIQEAEQEPRISTETLLNELHDMIRFYHGSSSHRQAATRAEIIIALAELGDEYGLSAEVAKVVEEELEQGE